MCNSILACHGYMQHREEASNALHNPREAVLLHACSRRTAAVYVCLFCQQSMLCMAEPLPDIAAPAESSLDGSSPAWAAAWTTLSRAVSNRVPIVAAIIFAAAAQSSRGGAAHRPAP